MCAFKYVWGRNQWAHKIIRTLIFSFQIHFYKRETKKSCHSLFWRTVKPCWSWKWKWSTRQGWQFFAKSNRNKSTALFTAQARYRWYSHSWAGHAPIGNRDDGSSSPCLDSNTSRYRRSLSVCEKTQVFAQTLTYHQDKSRSNSIDNRANRSNIDAK